jgi:acetyl-CoA C-acetyltransferase
MDAVLTAAKELAHDRQAELDFVEFYSCFPCVPKMARRVLEWPANKIPTVTGGLTFFGGPYNNYMSHGTAAMTRRLRESRGSVGLLYGQGGFVTKHHALLVATRPPNSSLSTNYNVQEAADRRRGPAPVVDTEFVGAAKVETYTIIYDRQGAPDYAVVFTRTDTGSRVVGRVDSKDGDTMAFLMKSEPNVIGTTGRILSAKDDLKRWSI